MKLAPFWRYYGGKNRAAKWYPAPEHDTIVEPFAGAAGYSCRYSDRKVILIDKSPIIAGMWRYLIKASPAEILDKAGIEFRTEAFWQGGFDVLAAALEDLEGIEIKA